MVRRFSEEERRRIVELWLDGNSYRSVSAKMKNASLGAISSIINEEMKKVPDLEELRKLNMAVKRAGCSIEEASRGSQFLEKLKSLNIPVDRLSAAISLLNRYGNKAKDLLEHAERLKELETSEGKTYDRIVAQAAQKTKELKDMTKRVGSLKAEEEALKQSLGEIEQLKTLSEKTKLHGLTIQRLDGFIEGSLRLEQLGFTPNAAQILANELSKQGLDPEKAAIALTSLLAEKKSLEAVVEEFLREKKKLQQDLQSLRDEQQSAAQNLRSLKTQIDDLVQDIGKKEEAYKIRIDNLESEYRLKKEKLQAQLLNLRREHETESKRIQKLRDDHEALQKTINGVQAMLRQIDDRVAESRPLATFASITEDPKSRLDQETVLKVSIAFFEGLKTHLEAYPHIISYSKGLKQKLEEVSMDLAGELRLASRKTA
jgi:predicted  nucleic acid-binding Zn-ribbon protein